MMTLGVTGCEGETGNCMVSGGGPSWSVAGSVLDGTTFSWL